jgi:hypothetical protein
MPRAGGVLGHPRTDAFDLVRADYLVCVLLVPRSDVNQHPTRRGAAAMPRRSPQRNRPLREPYGLARPYTGHTIPSPPCDAAAYSAGAAGCVTPRNDLPDRGFGRSA